MATSKAKDWPSIAATARESREQYLAKWLPNPELIPHPLPFNVRSLPLTCGVLTERQIAITESTPRHILSNISRGHWAAEEVLVAFCYRAGFAHLLTNPLSDVFFEDGIRRARMLDAYFRKHGETIGPLHGLPISLKDNHSLAGHDVTLGFVCNVNKPREKTAPLLQVLLDQGVVFYTKTNVPQNLASGACVNYIFGRTTSPFNTGLSAGGSSGGEGSLVSLGGSPLGLGTDAGGSIRNPANYNGIFGFIPSTGRLPCHAPEDSSGQEAIVVVAGQLCRSLDGLELYTQTLLASKPWEWDYRVVDLPWRQERYDEGLGKRGKLCFGIVRHDGVVLPHPPIQRGMKETKEKLLAAGHEVIEMDPFPGSEMFQVIMRIVNADGGEDIRSTVKILDEPLVPEFDIPTASDRLNVEEFWDWSKKKNVLRAEFLSRWQATAKKTSTGRPIDGMLLPSGAHVAPPHGTKAYLLYEAISNLVDCTCASIPVGIVNTKLDKAHERISFLSSEDKDNWNRYKPEFYKNAPIVLQLMGLRHSEEKVLGLMRTINKAFGRNEEYQA
ncbi:putative fatty-acid amide hydrolase [Halenospora varia]|nr:putative fatty-acid amide hydrolase [Halenospora varia]